MLYYIQQYSNVGVGRMVCKREIYEKMSRSVVAALSNRPTCLKIFFMFGVYLLLEVHSREFASGWSHMLIVSQELPTWRIQNKIFVVFFLKWYFWDSSIIASFIDDQVDDYSFKFVRNSWKCAILVILSHLKFYTTTIIDIIIIDPLTMNSLDEHRKNSRN